MSEGSSIENLPFIDEDNFIQLVVLCQDKPNWCAVEMNESFFLYDVDGNGYVDAKEIKRTFAKLGESLAESEAEDQLREYDIDGDNEVKNCRKFVSYHNTLH